MTQGKSISLEEIRGQTLRWRELSVKTQTGVETKIQSSPLFRHS